MDITYQIQAVEEIRRHIEDERTDIVLTTRDGQVKIGGGPCKLLSLQLQCLLRPQILLPCLLQKVPRKMKTLSVLPARGGLFLMDPRLKSLESHPSPVRVVRLERLAKLKKVGVGIQHGPLHHLVGAGRFNNCLYS